MLYRKKEVMTQIMESIKIWLKAVQKKGKLKYFMEVFPSISLTILSFLVVNDFVVEFINGHSVLFICFILVILIFNIIIEVNREVEVNDIKLECDKNIKEKNDKIEVLDGITLKLGDELEQLKQALQSLPYDLLHDFSDILKLENSERITFYLYKENKFINIARHSNNSNFVKTQFGNTFEPNDNYISKCFHNENDDFFMKGSLPDPDTNFDKYCQAMSKDFSNFDKEELKKVTMKSRCYFGKKIYGYDRNPIGVLMIESKKPNLSIMIDGSKKLLSSKEDYRLLSDLIDQKFQFILQSIHKNLRHYYKGVE